MDLESEINDDDDDDNFVAHYLCVISFTLLQSYYVKSEVHC